MRWLGSRGSGCAAACGLACRTPLPLLRPYPWVPPTPLQPFDLSSALFVATANRAADIPAPLLDRLEVVQLGGYTLEEKVRGRGPLPSGLRCAPPAWPLLGREVARWCCTDTCGAGGKMLGGYAAILVSV